jgi:hypothetical protein
MLLGFTDFKFVVKIIDRTKYNSVIPAGKSVLCIEYRGSGDVRLNSGIVAKIQVQSVV